MLFSTLQFSVIIIYMPSKYLFLIILAVHIKESSTPVTLVGGQIPSLL
jgi:hypothetical protein